MAQMLDSRWYPPEPGEPLRIEQSWLWIVVPATAPLIHVAVLGPGVRFQA